jgi:transcriptional regulator with XRE-family HTH domain
MAKYPTFGHLLKSMRENHPKWGKISQAKFCKENRITATWLSQIETGKVPIGENQLKKLAGLYGVSYLELLIYRNRDEIINLPKSKRIKLKSLIKDLLEKSTNLKE